MAGLAGFCIQETSSQDGAVGEEFQVASFSRDKAFQFYSDDQLKKIQRRCAELKTELQTALFRSPSSMESDDTLESGVSDPDIPTISASDFM